MIVQQFSSDRLTVTTTRLILYHRAAHYPMHWRGSKVCYHSIFPRAPRLPKSFTRLRNGQLKSDIVSMTNPTLLPPRPIQTPRPPNFPFLQRTHPPPLPPPRSIHESRRLNRNPLPGPHNLGHTSILPLQWRHIKLFPSIKLERRLRALDLEIQPCVWMTQGAERPQR